MFAFNRSATAVLLPLLLLLAVALWSNTSPAGSGADVAVAATKQAESARPDRELLAASRLPKRH